MNALQEEAHKGVKIYMPEATQRRLKAEAAYRGTSVSALVVGLINVELAKSEKGKGR